MEMLTINDTADELKISRWTVQRLVDTRKLAAVLVGAGARKRQQRIRRVDLDQFVADRLTIRSRPEPMGGPKRAAK